MTQHTADAIPAAMHANGFACDDDAIRTVDVLAFCSWSAWRMKIVSSARACTGLTRYGAHLKWREVREVSDVEQRV